MLVVLALIGTTYVGEYLSGSIVSFMTIFPEALTYVEDRLQRLNPGEIKLRMGQGKDGPIITENGNMILDVWMDYIPENTESTLKSITGVLESGLFMNYKVEVLGLTS